MFSEQAAHLGVLLQHLQDLGKTQTSSVLRHTARLLSGALGPARRRWILTGRLKATQASGEAFGPWPIFCGPHQPIIQHAGQARVAESCPRCQLAVTRPVRRHGACDEVRAQDETATAGEFKMAWARASAGAAPRSASTAAALSRSALASLPRACSTSQAARSVWATASQYG